jgi:hypothetical protein
MNIDELLKGLPDGKEKKKTVTVIKLSPLDKLAKDDAEMCPECGKPMSECECKDSEDGEDIDIAKILKGMGVDLSKLKA